MYEANISDNCILGLECLKDTLDIRLEINIIIITCTSQSHPATVEVTATVSVQQFENNTYL